LAWRRQRSIQTWLDVMWSAFASGWPGQGYSAWPGGVPRERWRILDALRAAQRAAGPWRSSAVRLDVPVFLYTAAASGAYVCSAGLQARLRRSRSVSHG